MPALRDLYLKYRPCIVRIGVTNAAGGLHTGTGFHIGDGLIVTARHVMRETVKKRSIVCASQIRAMLHAWEKHGLANAEFTYLTEFRRKYRSPFKPLPQFEHVVRGKIEFIGMVRGKDDPTYSKYLNQFNLVSGTPASFP